MKKLSFFHTPLLIYYFLYLFCCSVLWKFNINRIAKFLIIYKFASYIFINANLSIWNHSLRSSSCFIYRSNYNVVFSINSFLYKFVSSF